MAGTTIPFVQARNYTRGRSNPIDVIVIHTMESPEKPDTAESVANWFAGSTAHVRPSSDLLLVVSD